MRFSSLLALLVITASSFAWAGSVSQMKGQKLLILMDGEELTPGSEVFILNSDGKKIGLVTIKAIKGNKALGELTKGRANIGDGIRLRGIPQAAAPSDTADNESESSSEHKSSHRKGKHKVGAMLGYAMNTLSLTAQQPSSVGSTKEAITLKDSGVNAKAFYDYPYSDLINIRASVAYENFNTAGTTNALICDNGTSTSCTVAYSYLGLEGAAQINLVNGKTRIYIGGGYEFLLALGKQNNIPNLSDSTTNQMVTVSTGADIGLKKGFIPVVLEYGFFPGSSNVNASSIIVRGGYGLMF